MANGFEVNITETEFKAKSNEDQTWILFQGIMMANQCISKIETTGCEYSKQKHRNNLKWVLSAMSGGIVFALGIVYIIYQMISK